MLVRMCLYVSGKKVWTYAKVSVTVVVPSLFHFVVVYFRRPSSKIISVVVSVPGRIGRAVSPTSGSSKSFCRIFVSPCNCGRDGTPSSGSYSLLGNWMVKRPATNAANDAVMANPAPHHMLALNGSSLRTGDARKTRVSIEKTLPQMNNQPHPRSKRISKYAQDAMRSASTPAPIHIFAITANPLADFMGPSKKSFF